MQHEITHEQAHRLILSGAPVNCIETRNEKGHCVFRYYLTEPQPEKENDREEANQSREARR